MANAPLVYSIGQVAFSPVLKMENYIDEIQENLRKKGFPKFLRTEVNTIKVEGLNPPKIEKSSSWIFQNKESTSSVCISQEFITFDTTHYETFDPFVETFGTALEILRQVVSVELVERIALRYVDLVEKQDNETFEQYLAPGLVGFPFSNKISNADKVDDTHHRTESSAATHLGKLTIRTLRTNKNIPLPPDLIPNTLALKRMPAKDKWVTFIDFDHVSIKQRDFVTENIIEDFWGLHEICGDAFHAAITNYARKQWGLGKK